jgi:hypothetical protein
MKVLFTILFSLSICSAFSAIPLLFPRGRMVTANSRLLRLVFSIELVFGVLLFVSFVTVAGLPISATWKLPILVAIPWVSILWMALACWVSIGNRRAIILLGVFSMLRLWVEYARWVSLLTLVCLGLFALMRSRRGETVGCERAGSGDDE